MDLSSLNDQQRSAILDSFEQNTVLVAGAGSGKTFTVQNRIGYLIDDMKVEPENIMVMTFTNKASKELKERLSLVCPDIEKMWVGTFHSICVKILRMSGSEMGINKFTIMDSYDSKSVVKQAMAKFNVDIEKGLVKNYLSQISRCKNNLVNAKKVSDKAETSDEKLFASIYEEYQRITWVRKTFDFDDLIIYTILLLLRYPDTRDYYQDLIKYVIVDEFQDTNAAQLEFIKLITGKNNLFIVGDDDQSIYSFRNAKPEYLLKFQNIYPDAQVLYLEENYRSTKTIIKASNCVIGHNKVRHDKKMFCNNEVGDPILYKISGTSEQEAQWIGDEIQLLNLQGISFKNIAILYRTNAQSRPIEDSFLKHDISYKIVGGLMFYDRKEIKDLLSFLKLKVNPKEELSFRRLAGLQPGWGKKTIDDMVEYATTNKIDYIEMINTIPRIKRNQCGLDLLSVLFKQVCITPREFINLTLNITHYMEDLVTEGTPESATRIENINEFIGICKEVETAESSTISLEDFVNKLSLRSDVKKKAFDDSVIMTTIHAAKGLEYDIVFLVGAEEGLLPHVNSIPVGIEEERRLMYVGMTRAKKQLYITNAMSRREFGGNYVNHLPSRFIEEIPNDYICNV